MTTVSVKMNEDVHRLMKCEAAKAGQTVQTLITDAVLLLVEARERERQNERKMKQLKLEAVDVEFTTVVPEKAMVVRR